MGYTHYWSNDSCAERIPPEALAIIKTITEDAFKVGLVQREYNDARAPVVTEREILFNGVGEEGHETFCFAPDDPCPWRFCKTARKPYDEVVMKVLLVLAYYLEGLEISSDGLFSEEWIPAIDWFNQQIGAVYTEERLTFSRPESLSRLQVTLGC